MAQSPQHGHWKTVDLSNLISYWSSLAAHKAIILNHQDCPYVQVAPSLCKPPYPNFYTPFKTPLRCGFPKWPP